MLLEGLCIIFVATGCIYIGSNLKHWKDVSNNMKSDEEEVDETITLNFYHILTIPLTSSIMLVVLLYFFDYLQYILLLLIMISSMSAVHLLLKEFIILVYKHMNWDRTCISIWADFISFAISVAMLVDWLWNGDFISHDILACSLAIIFIHLVRLPNLKLAALLLLLLFVYDIYWVFVSKYHFDKNVMVEVATKSSSNPIQVLGQHYEIPILSSATPIINLPLKLIFPSYDGPLSKASSSMHEIRYSVLGLGDITVPGMLLAYARDVDNHSDQSRFIEVCDLESRSCSLKKSHEKDHASPSNQLFNYGLIGYVLGLSLAILASRISQHPQPALLYIVPSLIGCISGRALCEGRFLLVWNGPKALGQLS
jgi:hypothetical protein